MDNVKILNTLREYKKFATLADFARFLGVKPQALSNWYARNTLDIHILSDKFPEVDGNWLITGEGIMLKHNPENTQRTPREHPENLLQPTTQGGIPLIPLDAMAGFANGTEKTVLQYECEHYVVPMFRDADFLIPVKGSSMIPKYNSGDLVACKHIPLNDIFFQWNHVYVLDTDQGALIKRVQKAHDNQHILCVSDNKNYDPFTLHLSQIHAIAIVVGVIRLE